MRSASRAGSLAGCFSLLPRGERSDRLRSRRPRGSPSSHSRLHPHRCAARSTQPSFLGRCFLRRIATPLLELIVTSSPTHLLRQISLRSHHEQRLQSGLAWGSKRHSFIKFYGIIFYGTFSFCIGFESPCSLRWHTSPACIRHRCRTSSVSLPSNHPWDVAICKQPSVPLHRC